MKTIVLFFNLFCLSLSVHAQKPQTMAKISNFPDAYLGIYKGDLTISSVRGQQVIPMEFHLTATDSANTYNYTLVYGAGEQRQERLYTLIAKNAAKGDYVVDENNGIILKAKLVDNTLYSVFEVAGNLLTTTERFYKDAMDFEITFMPTAQKETTGEDKEGSAIVHTYPITTVQKAHLKKQ